jgi:Arc/MetJ-type ribon-helix-helix transcriptional regulator
MGRPRKDGENLATTAINVRLPNEMVEAIDQIVKRDRYNGRAELVREAIREFLKGKEDEAVKPGRRGYFDEVEEAEAPYVRQPVMANVMPRTRKK